MSNRPAQFFDKHGIPVNGDIAGLASKNNYMLSVSATPFSECSDAKHLNQAKIRVRLMPGETYLGVKGMLARGLIVGYDNAVTAFQRADWRFLFCPLRSLCTWILGHGIRIVLSALYSRRKYKCWIS